MPVTGIGLIYRINLNKKFSLNTGVEAGIVGRNYNISFYKNDFSPELKENYLFHGIGTFVGDLILSIPVSFEKRFFYTENRFIHGKAGIRLNYSNGADFDTDAVFVENINGEFLFVAEIDKYANNDAKPWISYLLSAGHSWVLKNNNICEITLVSNISFTKYVNGTYKITIPGKPLSEGYYSSSGTYFGIGLNYIFTNANYRIRRKYEKMNRNAGW